METEGRNTRKKYEKIKAILREGIASGELATGQRIPTERDLAATFEVSRPTVTRALNELAGEGLIERRVGAGSFVANHEGVSKALTFGLVVPGLGRGEIFEPVCARIAERAHTDHFTLSWGGYTSALSSRSEILRTLERYIEAEVDGVFVQPLELNDQSAEINVAVFEMLERNHVPTILLDADYVPFPRRSTLDLVGIDNIRAACVATEHLTSQGARRVDFVSRPFTATTATRRLYGYRLGLLESGITPHSDWEHELDPEDTSAVARLVESRATDLVCVSDETAALMINTLGDLGVKVPRDVRLVGFDDVKYARLVRVPLTTLRQPCAAIGDAAVDAMLSRLACRKCAPRDILLEAELTVRKSSDRSQAV